MKTQWLPDENQDSCEVVRSVLAMVGDKWSMIVLHELRGGPRRFNDLRRAAAPITQRMLSSTLQGLERDGLVTRTVHPTVPPQVEYELTPAGHSLNAAVRHLADWADDHAEAVTASRAAYRASGHLDSISPSAPALKG